MVKQNTVQKWVHEDPLNKGVYYVYELVTGKWERVKKLGSKDYSKHYATVYGIPFTP